jgi:hypothetical protein
MKTKLAQLYIKNHELQRLQQRKKTKTPYPNQLIHIQPKPNQSKQNSSTIQSQQ